MTNQDIKIINNISTTIQIIKIDLTIARKETNVCNIPITNEEYNTLNDVLEMLKKIDERIISYIKK